MEHERYMQRALQLARLGKSSAAPNPMVGCVIVKDDIIIGEGFHFQSGEPHAEVNAINSVADKSLLQDATLYVSLEPCSHFGKTPPCADLIIRSAIPRVVVCNLDPNPLVAGKGIAKLTNAGIEVTVGLLEKEGKWLNRRFFTFMTRKRPYLILKWAQTSDGFIARPDGSSKWISNPLSRKMVHKWRSEEPGILVGANTVLADNPALTTRNWEGKNPTRIVLNPSGSLSEKNIHLFDGSTETLIYSQSNYPDFIQVPSSDFLASTLNDLNKRKILSVLIEGGSKVLQSFIDEGLWDEARVFTSETTFGEGIKAPRLKNSIFLSGTPVLEDKMMFFVNRANSFYPN